MHITFAYPVRSRRLSLGMVVLGLATTSAGAQVMFQDVSIPAGFTNSYAESWGVSWGDINRDGYPDLFFNNHRTRANLYRNNKNGTFTEISNQADVGKTTGWTGGRANVDDHGVSWVDIDNDGDQDLWLSVSSGTDNLMINNNGVLTNVNIARGLDDFREIGTRQNVFLDYNGDRRMDVATITLYGSVIHPQLPDGSFGSGTGVQISTACLYEGQWAHLMDIHPSPGLELVCAPRNGTYPKVNTFSGGVVTDVSASYAQFSTVNDGTTLDFNRDLRPDLFLVRSSEKASGVYQGGSNRFESQIIASTGATKTVTFKTTGVITVIGSTDQGSDPQGDPASIDIGSTRYHPTSLTFQLDRNNVLNRGIATGSRGFNIGYDTAAGGWKILKDNSSYSYSNIQVTSTAPITNLVFTGASASDNGLAPLLIANTVGGLTPMNGGFNEKLRCASVVSGDFDNDMDEDLFLTCTGAANNLPDRLYLNNGSGQFTQVPNGGGAAGVVGSAVVDRAGTGDSVVVADYDLDGKLDLCVVNGNNMRPVYVGGPKQLFRNVVSNGNRWIELDLVGTTSVRDAIGSQVYVAAGGITQYREQAGGQHRWSQDYTRIHVGLGINTSANVTVQWPDGSSTVHPGLAANHVYQVKQDGTSLVTH